MTSLARKTEPGEASRSAESGLCTVLSTDGAESKARLLNGGGGDLLRWFDGLRPGGPKRDVHRPFVIHGRDVAAGALDIAGLAARLSADGGKARAVRAALERMRAEAATLLGNDGESGRIPSLLARLADVNARLAAAAAAEEAEAARIAALRTDDAAGAELTAARAQLVAERRRWSTLLQLEPEWQRLESARRELEALAAFASVPADAPLRRTALEQRREVAEGASRSLTSRLHQLRHERDELPSDETGSDTATETVRLSDQVSGYRQRLLELAGARARLAEIEKTLAEGLQRLGEGWDVERVSATVIGAGRGAELRSWQERFHGVGCAREEAERTLAAARHRLREAAKHVREDLGQDDTDAAEDDDDVRWRTIWRLRAALEEIWQVQSRAESRARAMRDREVELEELSAARRWLPSVRIDRLLGVGAVVAGVVGLWGGIVRGGEFGLPLAGVAVVLGVLRLGLYVRRRRLGLDEHAGRVRADRLRLEIDRLRRRRDTEWGQAAQLTESARTASVKLGLAEPVSIEAVDAYEHELAARLRSEGARTILTARLLELFSAQDVEQQAAAGLAAAEAARRGLEHEWEAWRADTELPADITAERSAQWLDGLRRTMEAAVNREAARRQLAASEPGIATWEGEVRALLRKAGSTVADDLCGSELTAALSVLRERVRREHERRQARLQKTAELEDAERRLAELQAELARTAAEWQDLLASAGAADAAALQAQIDGAERRCAASEQVERLDAAFADTLAGLDTDAEVRAELARGAADRWADECRRIDAAIGDIDGRMAEEAARRLELEAALEAGRGEGRPAELRLERETLVADIDAAARDWQLRTLAAALLDVARQEHEAAQRHDLLRAASGVLLSLTRGQYTAIDRADTGDGLVLLARDANAIRIETVAEPVRRCVALSLLLARADQRTSNGAVTAVVVDDLLADLPNEEVGLVAQQITNLARAHPTVYLTTHASRAAVLSVLPGSVAVREPK
jgi:uncharacterized protein YhaN